MKRFELKLEYGADVVMHREIGDTVEVRLPMFSGHGGLLYGLETIKRKLCKEDVYPTELGFDVMSLATMVYMADTRIERAIHGQDSWTREIKIDLPVSDAELWSGQVAILERMLKFLTGDIWSVSFSERKWQFVDPDEIGEKTSKYEAASLFSGGMDSLISTINLMEENKNTMLISHAGDGLTKNAQSNIVKKLNEVYPDTFHTWFDLWLVFSNDYIPFGGNDRNTRSRSFLFIAFGIWALTGLQNGRELLVPENGLIALNVPLDTTRVGSYSTRTTHPFYLHLWNDLLSGLGLHLKVRNSYWNKTKGEMAAECKNRDLLYEMMRMSFSCSSPLKARWQSERPQHCGYCVPCLIRRAAMHKAFGTDSTEYLNESLLSLKNGTDAERSNILSFQYAIEKLKRDESKALLDIYKPGPVPADIDAEELADTYRRGLMEVGDFIQDSLAQEDAGHDL